VTDAKRTESTDSRRRAVIGYALVFSLPVCVGVAVMLLQVTGSRPADPIVFGPSLVLAAAVFVLVVAIGVGGSTET
jgi:putative copper export protein